MVQAYIQLWVVRLTTKIYNEYIKVVCKSKHNKGGTMRKIQLTLSDELEEKIKNAAEFRQLDMTLHIMTILEKLYIEEPFDYEEGIKLLIKDVLTYPKSEFVLTDIPYFKTLPVAKANGGTIKPSEIRARLGKTFRNLAVEEKILGVSRKMIIINGQEKPALIHNTAVYSKNIVSR